MANRSNSTAISYDELAKMKTRANLIQGQNPIQKKQLQLYNQSLERTAKWKDNYRDLKKRKQQERFKKFEKEQLERRRIDEEEKAFQQVLKENQLQKANNKLFQDTARVRQLNAKLLFSDTLQGRQKQLQIKQYLQSLEKNRQQYYHEQLLNQIKKQEEEQRIKKQQQKEKLKQFQKGIRKQHKQVKKQYIQKMKDQIEEGQIIKAKAIQLIQEQEQKQKQRRIKAMQLNKQINQINQKNRQLKEMQQKKQQQEAEKIKEYRTKQQILNDLKKKTLQNKITDKIKQREELCEKQADILSKIKDNQIGRINKQMEEIKIKQQEEERKKQRERQQLKQEYQLSLKQQVIKRQNQKQSEMLDNINFKTTWNSKLEQLKQVDKTDQNFRKQVLRKNAQDLKKQMEEKQKIRQQQFKKDLQQAEKVKAHLQNQDIQFKSYAQKSMKQWSQNGKNLIPIIKHLTATMKQN